MQNVQLLGRGTSERADWEPRASPWDAAAADGYARWRRGAVEPLLRADLPPHALDLQRALLSMFQFQIIDGERNETDASGECDVLYETVSPREIRKTKVRVAAAAGARGRGAADGRGFCPAEALRVDAARRGARAGRRGRPPGGRGGLPAPAALHAERGPGRAERRGGRRGARAARRRRGRQGARLGRAAPARRGRRRARARRVAGRRAGRAAAGLPRRPPAAAERARARGTPEGATRGSRSVPDGTRVAGCAPTLRQVRSSHGHGVPRRLQTLPRVAFRYYLNCYTDTRTNDVIC